MLSVPQLDDLSFEKLFDRARSRIPVMTQEWTDFNAHDPGITTLQTFAWLTDTLNYYMDATGDAHRLKYFKLLGIQPRQEAARCMAEVQSQGRYVIPRGTRLDAAGTVFEVPETCTGSGSRVVALYRAAGGRVLDITRLAGVDGGFAELFSYQDGGELYIGFDQPLEGSTRFYVQVEPAPGRNPVPDGFSLVDLRWESFDGSRWRPAALAEDGSCGFLRSGMIHLELAAPTAPMEQNPLLAPAHYLRCTLCGGTYDLLPRLGRVAPCCIPARQTRTYTRALETRSTGEHTLPIDYCIRPDDLITVAVEEQGQYVTWYEHRRDEDSLCDVVPGEAPWQRLIRFDGEEFGREPQPGQKLLVLITPAEYYGQMVLDVTRGCASERIDFQASGLLELQVAMVTPRQGRACYELWHQCEDLDRASWEDRVFCYDAALGQLVFGDGINGRQPPTGAIAIAVTVVSSSFERGNVRAGQLNRLADDLGQPLAVQSLEDAHGGQSYEGPDQLTAKLEEKLTQVTRAVTAEDYQRIVMATPGLRIDQVRVITAREYAAWCGGQPRPNTVLLAVKPLTHEPHPGLNERTCRLILRHLEPYRLLTTHVQLVPPQYVGVQVFGRIDLRDDTPEARCQVEELLHRFIDFNSSGGFGRSIAYGQVFSGLEMLDCVRNVLQLSFEVLGRGAVKNERGDIEVCPDGLAYVQRVEIEYL